MNNFKTYTSPQSYIKYLAFDIGNYRLLTPIFLDDTGLAKFKSDITDPSNMKDSNIPPDAAVHVEYHTEIEKEIKTNHNEQLVNTVSGKHGHFPIPKSNSDDLQTFLGLLQKKKILSSKDLNEIASLLMK